MNLIEMIGLWRPLQVMPTEPAPVAYHCGVGDCDEPQTIVRQDDRETAVECPTHDCVTTWDTTARQAREQTIIRPRDNWYQHGVNQKK